VSVEASTGAVPNGVLPSEWEERRMRKGHSGCRLQVAAACLLLGGSVLTTGCGATGAEGSDADGGGTDTACPDESPPFESDPFDGLAAAFVIDTIRLGDPEDGEGFDLDCLSTGPDEYQPIDGPGGVDAQFSALAFMVREAGLDIDVDADMQRSIEDGRNLILFRLADVDDWGDDGGIVYLSVFSGVDADADPANNLTGRGALLVKAESLTEPDDLNRARAFFGNGILEDNVADGRLDIGDFRASGASVVLELAVNDTTATLPIHDARVLWDTGVIPSGDPPLDGRLVGGLLGGHVLLRDGVEFIDAVYAGEYGYRIDDATLRSIAYGNADMDVIPGGFTEAPCTVGTMREDCYPGQPCENDPDRGDALYCYEYDENPDAISVGFVFTAVSCDIVGIHAGTP
jgi:hypothetical protein